MLIFSGQVPINPETGKLVEGNIEDQTEQVMRNLLAVLAHIGIDFSHVAKSTIFLTDLANFQIVNEVYSKWLGEYRPARATIQVAALPLGAEVEIEMIASISSLDTAMLGHGSVEDMENLSDDCFSCQEK